jgi:hypothetical protein
MKSLIYHDPGIFSYEEKTMPIIRKTADAIVRIAKTTAMSSKFSKRVVSGKLQAKQLITHHFTLDEVMQAYDTFDAVMKEEALKVIATNNIMSDKVNSDSFALGMAVLEEKSIEEELIVNDGSGG